MVAAERIDLSWEQMPRRWYNVFPDLPRALDPLLDPRTGESVSSEYMERLLPKTIAAQETSTERWIEIPGSVLAAYRLWRPTPLFRAKALEAHLETPAEIYFKYEGASPTGSHKLNSALPQAYFASLEGIERLVTDTGAGQWGSALSLAGRIFGVKTLVYMVRSSFMQKPYRRLLMETYGAGVLPSPSKATAFGRRLLRKDPDHPGSEATAVTEAIETVREDQSSRLAMGGFGSSVLLHQTIVGLETRQQLALMDKEPDFLVGACGCGSNLGGLALPWVADKLTGSEVTIMAAESTACPTLTKGTYRYDSADASGLGPLVRTYTLGHAFVPPPIHAGGLRYHGVAPLIGLLRAEGAIEARAVPQSEAFEAGTLFVRLEGFLPAPETAHAIRAVIDLAQTCKTARRRAVIIFCFSGHGLLDLESYGKFAAGMLSDRQTAARDFAGVVTTP